MGLLFSSSYFAGGDWISPMSGVRAQHGVQEVAASTATSPTHLPLLFLPTIPPTPCLPETVSWWTAPHWHSLLTRCRKCALCLWLLEQQLWHYKPIGLDSVLMCLHLHWTQYYPSCPAPETLYTGSVCRSCSALYQVKKSSKNRISLKIK